MTQVRKDVLNGWKEIATYLGRDPRTVERWEKQRSLPVRRLPGSGRATVYALVDELDAWLASPRRAPELPEEDLGSEPAGRVESFDEVPGGVETGEPPVPDMVQTTATATRDETPGPKPWWAGALFPALAALLVVASLALAFWYRRALPASFHDRHVEEAASVGKPPHKVRPEAEELYLRGLYNAELRTPESLHHAMENFVSAIGKDRNYAPAYAGLASTYVLQREYAMLSDAEAYGDAEQAAKRALALDPDLPRAHAVLGFVDFFWSWDAPAAEQEFQKATRLDPTLALAHHWYGSMLTHQGRYDEGLRELNRAQTLDPSSSAILTIRALALGLSGHRDQGMELLNEAVSLEHAGQIRFPTTTHQVLASLSLLPPRDDARFLSEALLAADLRHDDATVRAMRNATVVYRAHGDAAMWRALLQQAKVQEQHLQGDVKASYAVARYEAAVGEKDRALTELSTLCSHHEPAIVGLAIDPLLAGLRGDPRFLQLGKSVGLPESSLR